MNRLRWEQNASVSYMYKYLHFSGIGFLSLSKRERLRGKLIKSILGRHRESESRWAWQWAKQRRESGLPREKMGAPLLLLAKNTVIFREKNAVFHFVKGEWVHTSCHYGKKTEQVGLTPDPHFLLPEDGGIGLPALWCVVVQGWISCNPWCFPYEISLKIKVHLFWCLGKTWELAPLKLLPA